MEPEIKIRGYHTDQYRHVNNARYLEFLEEGRWQLIEDHLDFESLMRQGYMFIAVNINIAYRKPARVNDIVVVQTGIHSIGNTSAVMKQRIVNKTTGTVCVEADVTFVVADRNAKPVKLKGEIRKILEMLPELEDFKG
jgi:thioesterase-3